MKNSFGLFRGSSLKKLALTLPVVTALTAATPALATTLFGLTGMPGLDGGLAIDTVTGTVTGGEIILGTFLTFGTFVDVVAQVQQSNGYKVDLATSLIDPVNLLILTFNDGGTLVGFSGGPVVAVTWSQDCTVSPLACQGVIDNLTFLPGTALTAVTPLPAALPLFASGLGAMGLFGWRRKRKALAA